MPLKKRKENTNAQEPSGQPLFDFLGSELFSSADPLARLHKRVKLPPAPSFDCNGLPHTLLINLQLPQCEKPALFGQALTGPTVNAALVFRLREDTARDSANDDAEHGIKAPLGLLKTFVSKVRHHPPPPGDTTPPHPPPPPRPCPAAPFFFFFLYLLTLSLHTPPQLCPEVSKVKDDDYLGRFKLLVRSADGVPSAFSKYNGKPVLVTGSGGFSRSECGGVMEVSVNMRSWAYPARRALYSNWDRLHLYRLHVGVCIEGRSDAELAERLLGCCMLSLPTKVCTETPAFGAEE